jgi:hypothetical protein
MDLEEQIRTRKEKRDRVEWQRREFDDGNLILENDANEQSPGD